MTVSVNRAPAVQPWMENWFKKPSFFICCAFCDKNQI